MRASSLLTLLISLSTLSFGASWGAKKDRIKLKDVTTLTLYNGQWTTGRRTRPVPQLQCIGGTAMCKFLPKTVQCYNKGSDGVDIQWECKADIPSNMRFNKIEVTCEGYDYPEDDYVLVGSCGLEYSLDTTDGTRPFPEPRFDRPDPRNIPKSHIPYGQKDEPGFLTVFVLGAMAFCMWLIYRCCIDPMGNQGARRGRGSPPPSAPPPPPGFKTEYSGTQSQSSNMYPNLNEQANPRRGGMGFLHGLGLGAIGCYLFSNRGQQRTEAPYARTTRREYVREEPPRTTTFEPPRTSWFNWGSSGSTTRRRTTGEYTNDSPSTSSTPVDPPATSEVSRNASGFGGTKRR